MHRLRTSSVLDDSTVTHRKASHSPARHVGEILISNHTGLTQCCSVNTVSQYRVTGRSVTLVIPHLPEPNCRELCGRWTRRPRICRGLAATKGCVTRLRHGRSRNSSSLDRESTPPAPGALAPLRVPLPLQARHTSAAFWYQLRLGIVRPLRNISSPHLPSHTRIARSTTRHHVV